MHTEFSGVRGSVFVDIEIDCILALDDQRRTWSLNGNKFPLGPWGKFSFCLVNDLLGAMMILLRWMISVLRLFRVRREWSEHRGGL